MITQRPGTHYTTKNLILNHHFYSTNSSIQQALNKPQRKYLTLCSDIWCAISFATVSLYLEQINFKASKNNTAKQIHEICLCHSNTNLCAQPLVHLSSL